MERLGIGMYGMERWCEGHMKEMKAWALSEACMDVFFLF
jgi:hypothetical protein